MPRWCAARGETAFLDPRAGPLVQKHPAGPKPVAIVVDVAPWHDIQVRPYVNCFSIAQPDHVWMNGSA